MSVDKTATTNPSAPPALGTASGTPEVPYTPSQFPGVMVRNVPKASASPATNAQHSGAQSTGKGWIYVKPGAKKPSYGSGYGVRGGDIWYEPGKTSAGGTVAHVGRSFHPYIQAKVVHQQTKNQQTKGKVALECIDGHNPEHHEAVKNGAAPAQSVPSSTAPAKGQ